MEIHYTVAISPVPGTDNSHVVIKATNYKTITLGFGYEMFDTVMWTGNPLEYAHAQVHLMSILAKICHEIANEVEEAGYTPIADLMLKLSEHK